MSCVSEFDLCNPGETTGECAFYAAAYFHDATALQLLLRHRPSLSRLDAVRYAFEDLLPSSLPPGGPDKGARVEPGSVEEAHPLEILELLIDAGAQPGRAPELAAALVPSVLPAVLAAFDRRARDDSHRHATWAAFLANPPAPLKRPTEPERVDFRACVEYAARAGNVIGVETALREAWARGVVLPRLYPIHTLAECHHPLFEFDNSIPPFRECFGFDSATARCLRARPSHTPLRARR